MFPISAQQERTLGIALAKFAPRSTIARAAGLLTAPQLQANTIRLELLVHLAVLHCAGREKAEETDYARWLNNHLGKAQAAMLEDPVEDAFLTNVRTKHGDFRVFQGNWESNDYFAQAALDPLRSKDAPQDCGAVVERATALLTLSDAAAERLNLQRWHTEPSEAKGHVRIDSSIRLGERARAVTFSDNDLFAFGLNRDLLEPFIFRWNDRRLLSSQPTGHTSLELHPLLDFGDVLVLGLPHAVSPAIRQFVVREMARLQQLGWFSQALATKEARHTERYLNELKENAESLPIEGGPPNLPPLHAFLLRYDYDKYVHVLVLHDNMAAVIQDGLGSHGRYGSEQRASLDLYVHDVAERCRSEATFAHGITMVVLGGLGRGFMLGFGKLPSDWTLSVIKLSDLAILADGLDGAVGKFLKCIVQKHEVEESGVEIQNVNGDFNFYCFWKQLKHQIVPRDMPLRPGVMINIGHDFVFPFRMEVRRASDRHMAATIDGTFVPVVRFERNAFFKALRERPLYASLNHLMMGVLGGVAEMSGGPVWFAILPQKTDTFPKRMLFQIWSGFFGLLDRVLAEFNALGEVSAPSRVIDLRLNLRRLIMPQQPLDTPLAETEAQPEIAVSADGRIATITFPDRFLWHFQTPDNIGERLVLTSIADSICQLRRYKSAGLATEVVRRVLGGSKTRIIHLFQTVDPGEYLAEQASHRVRFLAHEDFVHSKLRLSNGCTDVSPPATLVGSHDCNAFLHSVVDKMWHEVRSDLRRLDRISLLESAFAVHEAVLRDRAHWNRTAQAMIALYGASDDVVAVAERREQERNEVALPARTLLEMGVCECPSTGGRTLSSWGLDALMAKLAILLEAANDSDAIKGGLVPAEVALHENGEYTLQREFYQRVIRPFVANWYREGLTNEAGRYHELYQRKEASDSRNLDAVFGPRLMSAFATEYGLSLEEFADGMAELVDLAVDLGRVVVQSDMGTVRRRLTGNAGLSDRAVTALLRSFSIYHRDQWDTPPAGYTARDLHPWRFRRPLSAVVRPIMVFGDDPQDPVMYAVGSLRLGVGYVLDRIAQGQLPNEFFRTPAMRQYLGSVNDERGHAFARSVAEALRRGGWQVRGEVNMSELGAPRSEADGDIDVLAWKPSGSVMLLECKRLQLARTVAEISEICRRFRGEAKDDLGRHMRRANWTLRHPESLKRVVGFVPTPRDVDTRIVTNVHVPMMYLTSLPVPAEKIGPLNELGLADY